MPVRTTKRRGQRRYVIDIQFRNPDGTPGRFRRDAEVQTLISARAEERRRLVLLAETGSPEGVRQETTRPVTTTGNGAPSPTVTVGEQVKRFLASYGTTRLKPSTRFSYTTVIERLLVPEIGELPLALVDATTVRGIDARLVRRGAKPSTRRNAQCVLRSVLRHAREEGRLERMPELPALPRVGGRISRVMLVDEVDRLLAAATPRYRIAFLLAAFAGLRAGEVRALRWCDVELDRGVIVVRQSLCRGVVAPPKSGHERAIPLHATLRAALENAGPDKLGSALVTGPKPGKPWAEFALYRAFRRFSAKAGIGGYRLHDLRHAFVTELFASGAPAPVVQRLAGHEHLITTQRYAHATDRALEDAIRRLRGNSVVTEAGRGSQDQTRRD